MKKQFTKRFLSWFLAAVMTLGMAAPLGAASTTDAVGTGETELSFELVDNDTVSVARGEKIGDTAEEEPAADEVVRVSILLEDDATTARYSTEKIAENEEALLYRARLVEEQENIAKAISRSALGGRKLDVVWNLTLAANLISANVAYGDIEAIEKVPGVREVVLETCYEPMVIDRDEAADPNTATSGLMTGTYTAYAEGYTGAGSRVAIVDTGIDTDHQSFDNGAFLYSLEEGGYDVDSLNLLDTVEIDSVLDQLNVSQRLENVTADALYRSEKEPFGFNYVDNNLDIQHLYGDGDEHGAHVAGIAAANAYIPDGKGGYVSALDSVMVQGAAPDAQILTMRVFGKGGGAYDSDYMAAIEDAIVLGCDSVNLSLGSGNPGFTKSATAAYRDIMDSLEGSGLVATMSAGNSGHWAEQTYPIGYLYAEDVSMQMDGSPGSFNNALTVASADNIGFTGAYLTVDGKNVFYTETAYKNAPITSIGGDHEYVYVDGNGTDADFAAVADKLAGKIAVCNRGEISFYQKAENAVKYGAIATIVANNQPGTINMDLSDYTKTAPVISITQADGAVLKDAAASSETIGGKTVYFGTMTVCSDAATAITSDHVTMSSFSSWGVPGALTLKPEITAPGGSIYSVNGNIQGGKGYETMSGTSMAAPQIAGITALVAQYIRDNDLEAKTGLDKRTLTQSLLMSTATPLFDYDDDGYYYPVLQQGAGHVDVGAAIKAESYILMDESATDSAADGKVKAELGDDPARTGAYTVKFTVNNISGEEMRYVLAANMFTQAPFQYYVNANTADTGFYMDTLTTPLGADVEWIVDGNVADAPDYDLLDMDFDGSGVINTDDADAMLDYIVGKRASLNDEENADLDEDGEITSYDVYLFLQRLSAGSVIVPANGSVEIVANITLDAGDMEALDYLYPNGAYVEGYLYVKALADEEGAVGVTHSIPVLGFYGDWSDPSMYEHGQRITYVTGEDKYTPYLGSPDTNTLGISYAWDDSGTYYYTGNPLLIDFYNAGIATKYMPERNAINSADNIALWRITLIRNAAEMHYSVVDGNGKTLVDNSAGSNVLSAYYYTNGGTWRNTSASMKPNLSPAALQLSEGDTFTMKISGATEYSVKPDGSVDWDSLGDGASQQYTFTVDDTAPVVEKVTLTNNLTDGSAVSLNVTASDNQYIAGVILTNGSGTSVYSMASYKENIAPGESAEYVLPLDGVSGNKFMIQVVDYAFNVSTYTIREQIGEKPEVPQALVYYYDFYYDFYEGDYGYKGELHSLAFDEDGKTSLDGYTLYADMLGVYDETALAMEDVDGILVTSFADGTLYALRTADPLDGALIANIGISFTDFAYAGDTLYGVRDGKLYTVDICDGTVVPAFTDDENVYTTLAGKGSEIYATTVSEDAVTVWKLEAGKTAEEVTTLTLAAGVAPLSMDFYGEDLYCLGKETGKYNYYTLWKLDLTAGTAEQVNTDSYYWDELYCLVFPDPNGDESWTIPADDAHATSLTIDQEGPVQVLRGSSEQLTATVMPWFLEDRTVVWTSDDESIATVSANGKVTGISDGFATITATSKDGKVSDSVDVEVFYPEVYFEGALQDAEGAPLLFQWNVAEEDTWTKTADLSTSVSAACASEDKIFIMNFEPTSAPMISVIDRDTREVLEQNAGTAKDVAYWDMAYSTIGSGQATDLEGNVFEDNLLGVYGYYLITGGTAPSSLVFNLSEWLSSLNATFFISIANAGMTRFTDADNIEYDAERFLLLDDTCNIWSLLYFYDDVEEDFFIAIEDIYSTSLKDSYFNMFESGDFLHYLTSMVADENFASSRVVYISTYNENEADTSRIYRVNLTDGSAALLGDVGEAVWPAALYEAVEEVSEDMGGQVSTFNMRPAMKAEETVTVDTSDRIEVSDIHSISSAELKNSLAEKASKSSAKTAAQKSADQTYADTMAEIAKMGKTYGGLNGFRGTVRPDSTVNVDKESRNLILSLTAKDAEGKDVTSHNGKSIVTYDPTTLKLVSVNSIAAHYAYNDANGVITFAYADLADIAAGEPVATFVFERLNGREAGMTIDYKEVNNQKIGASEDITDICQHEKTIIRNAVPATMFRPGYTGDKYCAICGKLLARGEYIPLVVGPAYPENPKDNTPKEDEKPVEPKPAEEPETEPVIPAEPAAELPFTDVLKDHWFYEDVLYVYDNGLMNGISDTAFAPNETITRAMVVTILSRMSGEEIPEVADSVFSDVASGLWYSDAISWAASKNIVNGFEDGTFQPDAPMTRAQLVTILYRYAQYKGLDVSAFSDLSQFTDAADVPAYALEAMQWAVGSGLISGNGLLIDSASNATRAQVAAIIHRFLTR